MNDMVTHRGPADIVLRTDELRGTFQPNQLDGLPASAAMFLQHAIAPGAPLPQRVSVTMHGHIKVMGALVAVPGRAGHRP